jgi:hypothetical protein
MAMAARSSAGTELSASANAMNWPGTHDAERTLACGGSWRYGKGNRASSDGWGERDEEAADNALSTETTAAMGDSGGVGLADAEADRVTATAYSVLPEQGDRGSRHSKRLEHGTGAA